MSPPSLSSWQLVDRLEVRLLLRQIDGNGSADVRRGLVVLAETQVTKDLDTVGQVQGHRMRAHVRDARQLDLHLVAEPKLLESFGFKRQEEAVM